VSAVRVATAAGVHPEDSTCAVEGWIELADYSTILEADKVEEARIRVHSLGMTDL
jgi:hypothetical protein